MATLGGRLDRNPVVVAIILVAILAAYVWTMSQGTGKILPSDADVCAGRATSVPGVNATCQPP